MSEHLLLRERVKSAAIKGGVGLGALVLAQVVPANAAEAATKKIAVVVDGAQDPAALKALDVFRPMRAVAGCFTGDMALADRNGTADRWAYMHPVLLGGYSGNALANVGIATPISAKNNIESQRLSLPGAIATQSANFAATHFCAPFAQTNAATRAAVLTLPGASGFADQALFPLGYEDNPTEASAQTNCRTFRESVQAGDTVMIDGTNPYADVIAKCIKNAAVDIVSPFSAAFANAHQVYIGNNQARL